MSVRKLLALLLFVVSAATVCADDETPRRWSLIGGMDISCLTAGSHTAPDFRTEKAATFESPGTVVLAEYYLPNDHFSVLGGYMSETLEWYEGDVSVKMHNIALGARYYPLSRRCVIQPYAAVMAYGNVGRRHDSGSFDLTYGNQGSQGYKRDYTVSAPFLSVAPTVGFDVYILSSVALELQYGFPLAVAGKTDISTTYAGHSGVYDLHPNMSRHNVQIALKLTFPFRVSGKEISNSLYNLICMAMGIYDPNESPKKETKTQQRKTSLHRALDSY